MIIAMVVVVGVLVYLSVRLGRRDYTHLANHMAARTREGFQVLKPCPLCGTMLKRGETVHSVVFSGGTQAEAAKRSSADRPGDWLAHLFGCPYCYPANAGHPRICPVCRRELGPDDYVIARMFEKPGRKHVHVLGCTRCRAGRTG